MITEFNAVKKKKKSKPHSTILNLAMRQSHLSIICRQQRQETLQPR